MKLVLPLPPKALNPNSRAHWSRKATAVRAYRVRTFAEARVALYRRKSPRWERAELRATWYLPDLRRRDPDNLMASLKSAYDGLTDAGVLADDRGLIIHPPTLLLDRDRPRVELEIEAA